MKKLKVLVILLSLLLVLSSCGEVKEKEINVSVLKEENIEIDLPISEISSSYNVKIINSTDKVIKIKDIQIKETDWDLVAFNKDLESLVTKNLSVKILGVGVGETAEDGCLVYLEDDRSVIDIGETVYATFIVNASSPQEEVLDFKLPIILVLSFY